MAENAKSFEEALASLEKTVICLESGDCTLDEAIALFEKGMKCINECRSALKKAKCKIVSLTKLEEEQLND